MHQRSDLNFTSESELTVRIFNFVPLGRSNQRELLSVDEIEVPSAHRESAPRRQHKISARPWNTKAKHVHPYLIGWEFPLDKT